MKLYFLYIPIFIIFLASCSQENAQISTAKEQNKINSISVGFGTREGDPDDIENEEGSDSDSDLISSIGGMLEDAFVKDESKLYISQQGGVNVSPKFGRNADSNLYTYIYDGNEDATWANGFNFYPEESGNAISWNIIRDNGAAKAGFTLYGIYMPFDNLLPETENVFSVQKDQRSLENLKKSNILGAYHATTSLYTPLRFRLFHLTVFLDVYVYIPIYKFDEEAGYTGFMKNAYKSAQVINVNPNFTIEWDVARTSDIYPPLVIRYPVSEPWDIDLYVHTDKDGNPMVEQQRIRIPESYVGNIGEGVYEEDVYVYHFSVLFPPQDDVFPNSNFLKFQFNTPGNTTKTYYFNGADQTAPGSNLGMTQGTFQQLNLYLSRYGSDALLLRAKKMPWTPAETEMNITQSPTSN